MEPLFTIQVAASRTGLNPHRIRAWERRHGALHPSRSATRRRLYTEADVRRLSLLRRAVDAGHAIAQVAPLEDAQLEALTAAPRPMAPPETTAAEPRSAGVWLEESLEAVRRMDDRQLAWTLARASTDLGAGPTLDHLVSPLLEAVGREWQHGTLRPAHEHMATAVLRSHLGHALASVRPPDAAPVLVAGSPAGQRHELGALMAALTAAQDGWKVLYLGADLPAEEIAGTALRTGSRAVALSIVYPPDDPQLRHELRALRDSVGPRTALLAGGRSASAYRPALDEAGIVLLDDLRALREALGRLRADGDAARDGG